MINHNSLLPNKISSTDPLFYLKKGKNYFGTKKSDSSLHPVERWQSNDKRNFENSESFGCHPSRNRFDLSVTSSVRRYGERERDERIGQEKGTEKRERGGLLRCMRENRAK